MSASIQWLETDFQQTINRHGKALSDGLAPGGRWWHGPSSIRPMIELLSVMDAGQPMRITRSDYTDPERRWL